MAEPDSTPSDPERPPASQFSIKWLLWITLVTATVITLTARLELWDFAERIAISITAIAPQNRPLYLILAGLVILVVVIWIIWFGFRLPYLYSSYRAEQKKRAQRIAELQREISRVDDTKADGP